MHFGRKFSKGWTQLTRSSHTFQFEELSQWPPQNNTSPMKKESSQKSSTRKRKVRFISAPPNVRLCSRIEEPIWYEEKDFVAFELENRKTISLLTKHKLSELHPEKYCIDGLEFRISKPLTRIHHFRGKLLRQTILMQQHLQKCEGKQDSERLKEISQLFSKSASYRAQMKAAIFHALAAWAASEEQKIRKIKLECFSSVNVSSWTKCFSVAVSATEGSNYMLFSTSITLLTSFLRWISSFPSEKLFAIMLCSVLKGEIIAFGVESPFALEATWRTALQWLLAREGAFDLYTDRSNVLQCMKNLAKGGCYHYYFISFRCFRLSSSFVLPMMPRRCRVARWREIIRSAL